MDLDPNRRLRAVVRDQLTANSIAATDYLLDLLVDAVLDSADRAEALQQVTDLTDLTRGRAAQLVDLATEALKRGTR